MDLETNECCYLCGKKFDNKNTKKHDEHIIQQAIGGNLIADNILCASCGEILGKEIDKPFVEIFDPIVSLLNIRKDRDSKNNKGTKAYINGIEVVYKNKEAYPVKPFHLYTIDKKEVLIFAGKKQAKNYRKKVENELKENFKEQNLPKINIISNIADMEGVVEFPINIDNLSFKKGLAKIAIGFAIKNGVKREDLPLVLEVKKDLAYIKNKIIAIPFYPLGLIDQLIEFQRSNFQPYPIHNLILFTLRYDPAIPSNKNKKVLICYIELFSTFQFYIVLNEEYYGEDIYKEYHQQIIKKESINMEFGRRYYKERPLYLKSLNITEDEVKNRFERRQDKYKNIAEAEQDLIIEKLNKTKYDFDFEEFLNFMLDKVMLQVLLYKQIKEINNFKERKHILDSTFLNKLNPYIKHVLDTITSNEETFIKLLMCYRMHYQDNFINMYRRFYCNTEVDFMNYYDRLLENFKKLQEEGSFREYGYLKIKMLFDFMHKKRNE